MIRKVFYISFFFIILFPTELFSEYKNTNGKAIEKTFQELLKWTSGSSEPVIDFIDISSQWKDLDLEHDDNFAIWIGHSTYLIKKDGYTILTDPIFSERASPLKNIGPKRLIPPSIPISYLPKIDFITISHNHYDHLDIPSLKKISKANPDALFFVPKGDQDLLNKKGIKNVYEFDWWESFISNNIEIIFTPVQHWSKRGLFDRNESLWGGWFLKFQDYSIYHAGDTGYSDDFKETRLKLGAPKYAFIPIGAYDPEWFMEESHVNPEDAVRIMIDLEAERSFGMHWATFQLTDEDTIEPKIRLEYATKKMDIEGFIAPTPGEILRLQ